MNKCIKCGEVSMFGKSGFLKVDIEKLDPPVRAEIRRMERLRWSSENALKGMNDFLKRAYGIESNIMSARSQFNIALLNCFAGQRAEAKKEIEKWSLESKELIKEIKKSGCGKRFFNKKYRKYVTCTCGDFNCFFCRDCEQALKVCEDLI